MSLACGTTRLAPSRKPRSFRGSCTVITPLDEPIVCPITIGRAPHLQAIERLLTDLATGKGQVLLVTGEAGIGKSRLVAEVRARAAEQHVEILQALCFETDRALPYAPFIDLLPQLAEATLPADAEQ